MEENVKALCDLAPEYADDLLGNVDQPLKVLVDEDKGREFLGCDYNRDGDSFRFVYSFFVKSPWLILTLTWQIAMDKQLPPRASPRTYSISTT